ncbi:MAG: protoporphyrinogen oxidase [Acidobacteriota bacterium]|nr:protoporphyrinogen oxidase [Acidobacteriota bacterium]
MKKVCVIGGGISGLCVAYRLKKKGVDVLLVERNAACGGNIETERDGDFLIEWGPNSVLRSPHLLALVKEIGLLDEIANANATSKKRYVVRDGKLCALPLSVAGLIRTKFFSGATKFKIFREPFVASQSKENESVSDFFRRRFGQEIVDYALDPFVSGIYAGNPEKLSLKYAFPRLFELESRHGGVLRGFWKTRNENKIAPEFKNISRTLSFKNGMRTIIEKLVELLPEEIKTGTEASEIIKTENGKWKIKTNDEEINAQSFDAVIVAAPSFVAAKLIENLDAELAGKLNKIYHPPLAVVVSAFRKADVKSDLDGFGFLVPKVENRQILGSLWSSVIFENRAPGDFYLMTTFIGGARDAELFNESDENLFRLVFDELGALLGLKNEPVFQKIRRWEKAIPQYNLGYEKTVEAIEKFKRENKGIFFCSNFYRGVSVGDCVKNSLTAGDEVFEFLENGLETPIEAKTQA